MKEYIEREALIENTKRVYCAECNSYNGVRCRACGTGDALDIMEDAPAADVVEVVRCKDCILFVDNKEAFVTYCRRGLKNITVRPDDYCSYGEKKWHRKKD